MDRLAENLKLLPVPISISYDDRAQVFGGMGLVLALRFRLLGEWTAVLPSPFGQAPLSGDSV